MAGRCFARWERGRCDEWDGAYELRARLMGVIVPVLQDVGVKLRIAVRDARSFRVSLFAGHPASFWPAVVIGPGSRPSIRVSASVATA